VANWYSEAHAETGGFGLEGDPSRSSERLLLDPLPTDIKTISDRCPPYTR